MAPVPAHQAGKAPTALNKPAKITVMIKENVSILNVFAMLSTPARTVLYSMDAKITVIIMATVKKINVSVNQDGQEKTAPNKCV